HVPLKRAVILREKFQTVQWRPFWSQFLEFLHHLPGNGYPLPVINIKKIHDDNGDIFVQFSSQRNASAQQPGFADATFFLLLCEGIVKIENPRRGGIGQPLFIEPNFPLASNKAFKRLRLQHTLYPPSSKVASMSEDSSPKSSPRISFSSLSWATSS